MLGVVITFKTSELKKEFNDAFMDSYDEIEKIFQYYEGKRITENFYTINCCDNVLTTIYKLVEELKSIKWVKKCISNLKIFKIKDYSDFTNIIKEK